MSAAALAVGLLVVDVVLAFGIRIALQYRRTGSLGLSGLRPGARPVEWLAGAVFLAGIWATSAGPVLDLVDAVEPLSALDGSALRTAGAVLAATAVAGTFYSQLAMGDSWRIGIPAESTALVTGGIFGVIRNPIYTAMIATSLGLAMLTPNPVSLIGVPGVFLGLEMQVRLVEEPFLRDQHGKHYGLYLRRVGRFLPGLGRARGDG